jgi:hypothetical protein
MSYAADWDLWVRLAAVTEFLHVPRPLVKYRQHDLNMSRQVHVLEQDSIRLLERGFALDGLPAFLKERRRRALARNYLVLAGSYFRAGLYPSVFRCSARSLALDPSGLASLARAFFRVASARASQKFEDPESRR